MSSLAPAPEAGGTRARPAGHPPGRIPIRVTGDSLLGLAIAAALCLLAFTTTGGDAIAPNTWAQIVQLLIAAGLGGTVLLIGRRGPAWGRFALLLFAALAALTYASIAWSVQPASSWLEANRTLSYLAAFGAATALARLAPGRWRALLGGLALYSLVVCGYALLTKVFPGSLAASDTLGRLRAPFDYFNATGLAAALGLPAWLWIGAARDRQPEGAVRGRVPGSPAARLRAGAGTMVAVPVLAVLVCALVLSYGRGALAAAVIGLAGWFVFVPVRLRATLLLGLGVAGGAAISIWASGQRGVTHDYVDLGTRTSQGHGFGVVLLVAIAVLLSVGAAVVLAEQRVQVGPRLRRRIGIALIGLLALVPVAGAAALAASSRGFGGQVSHLWTSLTSPNSFATDSPGRLGQLGSSRPRYWGNGLKVGEHAPLAGTGAFGFATATKRYSADKVATAHSYVIQTFADFGAIGLAMTAALLIAWGLAVRRTLAGSWRPQGLASAASGPDPPAGSPDPAAAATARDADPAGVERAGLLTLLAIAVIFGIHSTIDWTWFIPGVAVPALVCAGWLAGRGPLAETVGRRERPRGLSGQPLRGAATLALGTLALLAAWVVWQPLRSSDADAAAVSALMRGDAGAALTDARTAASAFPVDAQPLEFQAQIYSALGDPAAARSQLVKATSLQPSNPDTWLQLSLFDGAHGRPADARREYARVQALEPYVSLPPLP